jgi:hypothetical protein
MDVDLDEGKLDENKIREARKKRLREIQFWTLLKKSMMYLIFIGSLFMVSYSARDPHFYRYKHSLEEFFVTKEFRNVIFT